jgi:hypothetical protein
MKWGGIAVICLFVFSCLSTGNTVRNTDVKTANDKNTATQKQKDAHDQLKEPDVILPKPDVEPDPDKREKRISVMMDKDADEPVIVMNKNSGKQDSVLTDNKTKSGTSKNDKGKINNQTAKKTDSKTDNGIKNKTVMKPVTSDNVQMTSPVKEFKVDNIKPYKITKIDPREMKLIKEEIQDKNFDLSKIDNINVGENAPRESTVNENDEVIISLKNPGWIIKNISNDILKLLSRANLADSTSFKFKTTDPGETTAVFLRYDPDRNEAAVQSYKITVKPDDIFGNDKQKQSGNSKNKTEDFRKTVADNLFNQGKYADAKARYNELLKDGKASADIYYKLGIIEKESGNDAGALDNFQKNIKEKDNPYYGETLTEIMKLQKKTKKYQDAINSFYTYGMSDAIPKKSQEELYLLLADTYYGMNDFANAAKEYRRFTGLFPLSDSLDKALFYMAYSMESYPSNPDFKGAYGLYGLLVQKYPESRYYSLAKNRMLYLERHYLKIN